MKAKIAVIVDAYSSGNLYAPELKRRGVNCVHVQSTSPIAPVFLPSFLPDHFIANVVHESTEQTLAKLASYAVTCVIAGSEPGVKLADELSERLGLSTNGTALSQARRDKHEMAEAIRAKGVRAVQQMQSASLDDILGWVKQRGLTRCVLKPTESAGTDGVALCNHVSEIERAFHAISGKNNKLGILNDVVLAQEFLEGIEYIVDTVSCAGKPYVTDIWQYHKKETAGTSIYDFSEFLPAEGEIPSRLVAYAFEVLDALGIDYGCGHLEIMDTPRGPVLVEIGARPCGSSTPIIVGNCTGQSQINVSVDAYLDPAAFARKAAKPYVRKKQALFVYLISEKNGILSAPPDFSSIISLESYSRHQLVLRDDLRVHKTHDIFTTPGWVELVHENRETLYRDYSRVREIEKTLLT